MRRHLRDLTLYALTIASLLIAPHSIHAAPPSQAHRTVTVRVPPVYPELAKRMGISGAVTILAIVLPDGTVSEIHTQAGHPLLRQAAEDAVRHWHFAAEPNSSECIVAVNFELPR